jgi:two-component system sensor histidine kinase BarA
MMDARKKDLPILDWDLAVKIAGNQPDLAKDILAMLTRDLPNDLTMINQLAAEKQYPELLRCVHKLHGAVAYCGAPRLKEILAYIELQMKSNALDSLPALINQLNIEVNDLLEECRP